MNKPPIPTFIASYPDPRKRIYLIASICLLVAIIVLIIIFKKKRNESDSTETSR